MILVTGRAKRQNRSHRDYLSSIDKETAGMNTTQSNSNQLSNEIAQDDEALFKLLLKRPRVAYPTVVLLLASCCLYVGTISAYLHAELPLGLVIIINAIASYMAFTVMHDASHNAVSTDKSLNDWIGRIGSLILFPIPVFRLFRYVHMQHHRFANDDEQDPDVYCCRGSKWLLPLRWATLDLHYFTIYLSPGVFLKRPKNERREVVVAGLVGIGLLVFAVSMGWGTEYFLLYIVPTRIAVALLAFAFDFLPHYPGVFSSADKPYQSTLNRVGWESVLTPLLLSQNYHLVHHLYPKVPFYRYIKVWRAKENFHLAQQPAQTTAFGIGPKTV